MPTLGALPSRRASAACGSLTTETILEEVNHWQKIRDFVSGKKQQPEQRQQQQQPSSMFRLVTTGGTTEAGEGEDGGGDGSGGGGGRGLHDLIAVAEKLEQLKETDFGTNFRKYSIASQGISLSFFFSFFLYSFFLSFFFFFGSKKGHCITMIHFCFVWFTFFLLSFFLWIKERTLYNNNSFPLYLVSFLLPIFSL